MGKNRSNRNLIEFSARTCSGKTKLSLDSLLVGAVRTLSASSLVTDSAAGATAYACGIKTYNYGIAVDPINRKPCGTLLEAAITKGMRTGIVVTDALSGATPASFSSHAVDRNLLDFIAKQQVDKGIDLMFGGGLSNYNQRSDKLNLIEYAQNKGIQVVTNLSDFRGQLNLPAIALFAPSRMDYEIDRNPTTQPSLSEMVTRALNLLSTSSPNGFFLMVEGSNIDPAGHQNDAATNYRESLAYDATIDVILDFVNKNPNTIVVSTSDHETGGLALGIDANPWQPAILQNVTASATKMANLIISGQPVPATFLQYTGLNLTSQETYSVQNVSNSLSKLITVIGNVIAYRAGISWSTTGHTGVDVNLYSTGLESFQLRGNYDNTEVGNWVAKTFGFDLAAETAKLSNFSPLG